MRIAATWLKTIGPGLPENEIRCHRPHDCAAVIMHRMAITRADRECGVRGCPWRNRHTLLCLDDVVDNRHTGIRAGGEAAQRKRSPGAGGGSLSRIAIYRLVGQRVR